MKIEKLYLYIINSLRDGIYFVDTQRRITFWNKAAEEITGYMADEIVGRRCQDNLLKHIDEEGSPLCTIACPLFSTIIDGETRKAEVFLRHKDGHRIPVSVNIFPMEEDGEIIGAVEIFTQHTPVVYEDNLVESLTKVAMNDTLTVLPTRRYLELFIEYKINLFSRFEEQFCLMFLDIDDFASFNNNYGHDVGDAVLKNVAQSLHGNIRKTDLLGRWGGDEFVGVFAIKKPSDLPMLTEKIQMLINNTELEHNGERLKVTVSIGSTMVRNGDTVESIIERADKLMYQSKGNGKNHASID